jgi:hypothetical protein
LADLEEPVEEHFEPPLDGGFVFGASEVDRGKAKKDMVEPEDIVMKNGRPATKGTCPDCGTKMFKIGKS